MITYMINAISMIERYADTMIHADVHTRTYLYKHTHTYMMCSGLTSCNTLFSLSNIVLIPTISLTMDPCVILSNRSESSES